MYNINIEKECYDVQVIKLLFTEEEIQRCIQRDCREDRKFTTSNGVWMEAYICQGVVTPLHMSFSVCNREGPVNENFFLELPQPSEKKWVKIGSEYDQEQGCKILFTELYKIAPYCAVAWDGKNYRPAGEIEIPEGTFQLKDGSFAIGKYGKYEPNITFINKYPILQWEKKNKEEFNLPEGRLSVLRGDFFISKKGTRCFKVKENGAHILIQDGWGGAFSRYNGHTLPQEEAVYYRRASSNGGGMGYDYAVYPSSWQYQLSEEDI